MKSFKILYVFTILIVMGCSSGEQVEIPKCISNLDSLNVFPSSEIDLSPAKITAGFEIKDSAVFTIGRIGDVAVDEDGRIYIAALQQNSVLVFKPNGTYLTTLGNEGKGPGEFQDIDQLKINNNELFVYDSDQARINVYSLSPFLFSNTVNLRLRNTDELKNYSPYQLFIRNDGTFLMGLRDRITIDNLDEKIVYYYGINKSGEFIKKTFEQSDVKYFKNVAESGYTRVFNSPFHTKPLIVLSNEDNIFSSDGRDFLIRVHDSEGNYRRGYYYSSFDNVKVTEENVNSFTFGTSNGDNEVFQQMAQDNELPEKWPALNRMLIDNKNRLWVSTIVDDFNVYEWWVLSNKGKIVTKFEWPRSKPIVTVHNNAFFTREKEEETGLQKIARYNIELN